MSDFQAAKAVVRDLFAKLDSAPADQAEAALASATTKDYRFRGTHPFEEQHGAAAAAEALWKPLKRAFAPIQRREDMFFAGANDMDGHATTWVCSMGHYLGLFDAPFLTLQPTRKLVMLRYCEFYRVEGDRIAESLHFLDVMNLMGQIGSPVLPASTGALIVTPGPRTHDGLLHGAHPTEEGRATLDLIQRMVARLTGANVCTTKADLELDWAEDMLWWGPGGIGASYTQGRYLQQHCGPFEAGLDFVRYHGHPLEMAEGNFGGFFGWPSLTMRPKGPFMGLTCATDRTAEMRIVDLYRREGDKLAENWIFIDHLHFLKMLGVDLLERHAAVTGSAA